jgi:hypothetical protein
MFLLNTIETGKWLVHVEEQLMDAVAALRHELKWIEHIQGCWRCQMELKLDVERYLGKHTFWFLCLENEYLERHYRNCPKERNYHIGSYWEQVQYYEKYGNTDVPGENTLDFILDRSKWAYKIIGKQIHLARRMLRLVRTWDDSDLAKFARLNVKLELYFVSDPPFSLGVKIVLRHSYGKSSVW